MYSASKWYRTRSQENLPSKSRRASSSVTEPVRVTDDGCVGDRYRLITALAGGDDPDVAAFTARQATASPPDPARIDEICSRVLWARFGPPGTDRDDTGRDRTEPGRAIPAADGEDRETAANGNRARQR
jgi:hypothetical protein